MQRTDETFFAREGMEWKVGLEDPPPAYLQKGIPPGGVIVANNGFGDYPLGEEYLSVFVRLLA